MHKLVRTITAVSFAATCAFSSTSVLAQSSATGSIGYSHFDFDYGVELGAIIGSLGYEFQLGDNFSITPEARVGHGVNDDSAFLSTVKLGRIGGAAARFTYYPSDVYFFATTSLVSYELKSRGSSSSTEFGIGAGLGFYFTENVGLELQYENVDSVNVASAALRFRF